MVERATQRIHRMIDEAIDKMRPSEAPVPVILVGGGAILVSRELATASSVIVPDHAGVANAIGAAIAQVGGEVEQLVSFGKHGRDRVLADMTREAQAKRSPQAPSRRRFVCWTSKRPVSYMDDDAARIRVRLSETFVTHHENYRSRAHQNLCTGAAFLATGGGGDPYVSQLLAERILHQVGPAELISPGDLRDGIRGEHRHGWRTHGDPGATADCR